MWFITFILKNLLRRPLRSALTVMAIAIAIGAVVALVGVAEGFERSFLAIYEGAGIDLVVVRAGGKQRLNSALDEKLGDKIKAVPGVSDVLMGLADVVSFEEYRLYGVLLQGWQPETKAFDHLTVLSGRTLKNADQRAVMLGAILAKNMDKKVGDTIDILEKEPFTVVGIYESSNVFENGAMVIPLKQLQRLMDRPGQVTGFSIILSEHLKPEALKLKAKEIEKLERGIMAMPVQEHVESLSEIQLAKGMAWVTSAIAMLIGLFGMMNTMIMSVHERTREIGILRAVGWRQGRVVRMILLESVLLSIVGAVTGITGAILLTRLLTRIPAVSGFVDGSVSPLLLVYCQIMAIVVGLVGGAIPAIRAARMLPTAALRYE